MTASGTDYQTLTFTQSGPVTRITLNRPDAANGMNRALTSELAAAATRCDDAQTKVVVLTGSGRFFSAGGDLKAMATSTQRRQSFVKGIAGDLHRAISTFARMDAVLITAVNGVAAGAGFSLAVTGDLVIASASAKFTMAYTKAGLSPDGGATFYLPRLIGLRRTQELMLTNRTLTAHEALQWGLVNQVVDDTAVSGRVDQLVDELSVGAAGSNAAVKKLLLATYGNGVETQMELESRLLAANAGSADGGEGIDAFVSKRLPQFA